jgi:hypothetical protein
VKGVDVPEPAGGAYEFEHVSGLVESSLKEMTPIHNTTSFIKEGVIDDKINCQVKVLYSLLQGGTDEKGVLNNGYISWGNISICSFPSRL